MENTKKLTKKDKFEMLLVIEEVQKNELLVEFINHEMSLLAKKSSSGKKSKAQVENEGLQEIVYNYIVKAEGQLVVIKDMIKNIEELADFSNQKVSALLKKLVDNGRLEKEKTKEGMGFRIPVGE